MHKLQAGKTDRVNGSFGVLACVQPPQVEHVVLSESDRVK